MFGNYQDPKKIAVAIAIDSVPGALETSHGYDNEKKTQCDKDPTYLLTSYFSSCIRDVVLGGAMRMQGLESESEL